MKKWIMQCQGYGKEPDESIYPTPTVFNGAASTGEQMWLTAL